VLTGYEETPAAVSTTGRGEFAATVAPDGEVIQYTETYSGLQAPVTVSHIHVGQLGVTGSVVIFLCQTATNPDPTGLAPQCPQEGSVNGTITSANVIAGLRHRNNLRPVTLPRSSLPSVPGCVRECAHAGLAGRRDTRADPSRREIIAILLNRQVSGHSFPGTGDPRTVVSRSPSVTGAKLP
jgi:CHRD domain